MSDTFDPSRNIGGDYAGQGGNYTNAFGGPTESGSGVGGAIGGAGLDGGGGSGITGPMMAGNVALGTSSGTSTSTSTPAGTFGGTPKIATSSPDGIGGAPASAAAPKSFEPSANPSGVGATPASNPLNSGALPYAPGGSGGGGGGAISGPAPGVMSGDGSHPIASMGAGLDGGGGHGTGMGGIMAFAEGGAVPEGDGTDGDGDDDTSQDDGAMGQDPLTAMLSKAMDSVDAAFQYGRKKNGIGGQQQAGAMPTKPGQQSETPNSQPKPAPGTLSQNEGDGGDGDQASAQGAIPDDGQDDDTEEA